MGVIKQKFSLLAPSNVAKLLANEVRESLIEAGLQESQISMLCMKIANQAKVQMKGEYTVMGGFSPEEQLLDTARKIMHELDERGELENLLGEESLDVSEPDLEDAYNAASSIVFVGSEKQINWARDIATKASEDIARAWKHSSFQLPTDAKWWIDNRGNIYQVLTNLKQK